MDHNEFRMAYGSGGMTQKNEMNDLISKTNEQLTVLKRTGTGSGDLQSRIADLEEQMSEKASKQSVA